MLTPRKQTPDLNLPLAGGGAFSLSGEGSEKGTVVCFYRGLHCPLCAKYLDELAKLTPKFEERGVTTVAISSDVEDRAGDRLDQADGHHHQVQKERRQHDQHDHAGGAHGALHGAQHDL